MPTFERVVNNPTRRRLRDALLAVAHHGPLPRAAETARVAGEHFPGIPVRVSEAAGDYVPYADGVPEAYARVRRAVRGGPGAGTAGDRPVHGAGGRDQVRAGGHAQVPDRLAGARGAMHAPAWRWLGLNHAHAALTVIRYASDRPPSVLFFNDQSHLPAELRWTDFPSELRGIHYFRLRTGCAASPPVTTVSASRHDAEGPHAEADRGGVLVHRSEFVQANAVVICSRVGVLLIGPEVQDHELTYLADDLAGSGHTVAAGFSTHPDWTTCSSTPGSARPPVRHRTLPATVRELLTIRPR
ncbi:histidine phosphatase family protein [Nonomuraea composti]|uniref:histidine phosphatase family protein n=1 Tax=Nonomuraea composti TaxID=2720023 RepID=UPI001F0D6C8F|nr:histidine phosphatase family protein [Nonomuraea sp. FMUSA5-5]